jgi:hypothetical protein
MRRESRFLCEDGSADDRRDSALFHVVRGSVADPGDLPWLDDEQAFNIAVNRTPRQHLIVPQTILVRACLERIFVGLRDAGLDVFHIVLDADDEALRQRIQDSAEAQAWRLDHLAEYRSSRAWMIQVADPAVDTGRRTPAEIAHQIAAALPEPYKNRPAADEEV